MKNTIKAIAGGISCVKYYHRSLLKALIVPFVVFALVTALSFVPNIDWKGLIAIRILQWIPFTLIAITTHKIILEGPNSVPTWGINRFGRREVKFAVYGILIGLIAFPAIVLTIGLMVAFPAIVLTFIPYIVIFIFIATLAYIIGRFSLVFPSIAISSNIRLKDSWVATKDNKLMMIVVVTMFPFILGILEQLLASLPGMFWIGIVTSALTIVLVTATLSMAYKIVMDNQIAR